MTDPAIGDHYRPTTGDHAPGVYRVVGTPGDVTLLRVADGDGRRVHDGRLSRIGPETLAGGFEPASDPDAGVRPIAAVENLLSGLYWSVRRFL